MRKRLAPALVLLLMISALTIPALAFDYEAFREKNYDALAARGITLYGNHEFQEGLMPVLMDDGWNYINEALAVVDLNRGRFDYVFPFFEGLAAVSGEDGVGYIDTSGKLVIPCQYGSYYGMGDVWVGYFHDGTATVLKGNYTLQLGAGEQWQVGKIDKTGKLIEPYKAVDPMAEDLYLSADNGARTEWEAEKTPTKNDVTIQFTDAGYWLDNGLPYEYTLTNNTATPIQKYSVLLTYSPAMDKDLYSGDSFFYGQAHAMDINLAAGERISGTIVSCLGGLSRQSVLWIDFDSLAERDAFLKDKVFSERSNSDRSGYYSINGSAEVGPVWMKDTLGITIKPAK